MSAYALFQTNLGPKADNAAPQTGTAQPAPDPHAAAPAAGAPSAGGGLMSNLPLLLLAVMVPMYLLSTRGKNNKREDAARAGMKKGDRVMSESGLIGELVDLGERTSKVKLAPGITVEMLTSKINPQVVAAPAKDDKLKDLKDAKSDKSDKTDAKSSAAAAVLATPAAASAEKK